jgi:hypothetical protein
MHIVVGGKAAYVTRSVFAANHRFLINITNIDDIIPVTLPVGHASETVHTAKQVIPRSTWGFSLYENRLGEP